MSWSELERLVEAAEIDPTLRDCLRRCRSREDLVLLARHLGYRITRVDLQRAWLDHHQRRRGRSVTNPGAIRELS